MCFSKLCLKVQVGSLVFMKLSINGLNFVKVKWNFRFSTYSENIGSVCWVVVRIFSKVVLFHKGEPPIQGSFVGVKDFCYLKFPWKIHVFYPKFLTPTLSGFEIFRDDLYNISYIDQTTNWKNTGKILKLRLVTICNILAVKFCLKFTQVKRDSWSPSDSVGVNLRLTISYRGLKISQLS